MKYALGLLVLGFFCLVSSVYANTDVTGEYIVEVKGNCDEHCQESVRNSVSQNLNTECSLKTTPARIFTLTFIFLKCEKMTSMTTANSIEKAQVDANGFEVVSISKNGQIAKKGFVKSQKKKLDTKSRQMDIVEFQENFPIDLNVVPEEMKKPFSDANPLFFPSTSPSVTPSPSITPSVTPSSSSSPSPSSSTSPSPSASPSPSKAKASSSPKPSSLPNSSSSPSPSAAESTLPPTWGVDEVDGSDDNARSCTTSKNGEGINVAVLDTGCAPKNGGACENFMGESSGTCTDRDGHGTHVGGTIQDKNFGVSPAAILSCFKVLDDGGAGTYVELIQGISSAIENGAEVLNLSLGGYELDGDAESESLDNAVLEAGRGGVYFTIASGNEDVDSCSTSPGRVNGDNIYTIQSHDADGVIMSGSNWGTCTNLTAPGVDILSYTVEENSNGEWVPVEARWAGTSMAAPHAAGIIARLLSDGQTVSQAALTELGTVIKDRGDFDVTTLSPRCPE